MPKKIKLHAIVDFLSSLELIVKDEVRMHDYERQVLTIMKAPWVLMPR